MAVLGLFVCGIASGADKGTFASFIELPWRYVIGGYADGKWLKSEPAGKRLTAPKTTYKLFTLKGEAGTVTAGKAASEAEVCPDVWSVKITPEPDLQKPAIGVCAPWNPMPRTVKSADTTQDVYVKAVTELLADKGIAKPKIKITQVLRVDLEGDGEEEVVISGTHYTNEEELVKAAAGDYSFVALRRVVKGKVQTQILAGDFYPKSVEDAAPNIYKVSGVLDLNGDGVLEVIVNSTYYEGGGLQVWQLQKDKLVTVIDLFCGV